MSILSIMVSINNLEKSIPTVKENVSEVDEKVYKLSFIATGDALIHSPIYNDAKQKDGSYDFTKQLIYVKDIIKNYDIAYINQETLFAGKDHGYSTYPRFNTPSEWGDALIDTGFNIFSLANNHSLDKGKSGTLNAVKYWKNTNDVMYNGINDSFDMQKEFKIMEKNGITYTMLSYTTLTNGLKAPKGFEYLVNLYNKEEVAADIKSVRSKADIVIVAMHWGTEYSHNPSQEQIDIANYLSELGVDIIVGSHPHVLQPISRINNTLVMWSLGNFISSQNGSDRLTGVLASLDITKTVKGDYTITEIDNIGAELIYTYKNNRLRNYQVIPFSMMEDKYLKDYEQVYEKNKAILLKWAKNISVKEMKIN